MNLRWGLTAIAVLVTALALSPTSASADLLLQKGTEAVPTGEAQLAASSYPATVTGERLDEAPFHGKLTLLAGDKMSLTCNTVEVSGGTLSNAESGLSLTPSFSGCGMEPASGATIAMNGCSYRFPKFGPVTDGVALSDAEITCPSGAAIEGKNEGICEYRIPPQKLSSESGIQNIEPGAGSLRAVLVGSGLHYSVSGVFCKLAGASTGSFEDGSTEIDLRLNGAFLQEGTEIVPTGEAQLAASTYPSKVWSEQYEEWGASWGEGNLTGKLKLISGSGPHGVNVTCESVQGPGGTLSKATSELALSLNFLNCVMSTEAAGTFDSFETISMNGCSYRFSKFGPYTEGLAFSNAEITCPPGAAIEAGSGCRLTIPPQKLSSESGMQNANKNSLLAVLLGSGLHYSIGGLKPICASAGIYTGSFEDGSTEIDLRVGAS